MPKLKITSIRLRIEHIVEDFVEDRYYHERYASSNPSKATIRKNIMQELEPHIKAIHSILEKERDNLWSEYK